MSKHTFTNWLRAEVTFAKCSLLTLYEQRDKLRYIDGPRLEKQYMEQIGGYEESVIKEEIECELIRKKQQMIQTALNRKEPIDEAAIDAELDTLRQSMLSEAVGSPAPKEYAELSSNDSDKLQELYRDIVDDFHPQMHPELTEAHKILFNKAQDAYRRRDLAALALIHKMLYSSLKGGMTIEVVAEVMVGETDGKTSKVGEISTDYALASLLYDSFKPTAEEVVIKEELEKCMRISEDVMQEMEKIRLQFPYTAEEMLASPEKVQAYKDELALRLHAASTEIARRTREIKTVMERVAAHG